MDKIAIIQKYNDPQGIHEKACSDLALSGSKAGFDIIGMHKDTFDRNLLTDANLLVIANILSLHKSQRNDLENIIFNGAMFVRLLMDLSEIEQNTIDKKMYDISQKNYFCSPKIFSTYLDLGTGIKNGELSCLAGPIDESWKQIDNFVKEKAVAHFWRDIDRILQRKRILNNGN